LSLADRTKYDWENRCETFRMGKNNSELWNFFPELLNWFYFDSSHILIWNFKVTSSGSRWGLNVQPNRICHHVTFCVQVSCSNSSVISPTDTSCTQHPKLIVIVIFFILSIHIVNYITLPSLFSEALTELITELYLLGLVAYSVINCEAEFSSSFNYSIWVLIYFDDTMLDMSDG